MSWLFNRARSERGSSSGSGSGSTRELLIPPDMAPLSIRNLPTRGESSVAPLTMPRSEAPVTTHTRGARYDALPENVKRNIDSYLTEYPKEYKRVRQVVDVLRGDPVFQQARSNLAIHIIRGTNQQKLRVNPRTGIIDVDYYKRRGLSEDWIRTAIELQEEGKNASKLLDAAEHAVHKVKEEIHDAEMYIESIRRYHKVYIPSIELPTDVSIKTEQERADADEFIQILRAASEGQQLGTVSI